MSHRLRRAGRPDAGFTMVELLLAVAIMGIGVLGVVGGMMTSIQVSDLGRSAADGQVSIRAYAEAVSGDTYSICATTYPAAGFTTPTGWTPSLTVAYWNSSTSTFSSTCGTDSGLQRVALTLTATDGRGLETLRLVKRTP